MAGKLLEESGLLKRLSDLEASINELRSTAPRQTPASPPKPTYEALIADLGERTKLLDIDLDSKPITLRPKRWLRFEDFRAIGDVVKKHGGAWSNAKRAFTV